MKEGMYPVQEAAQDTFYHFFGHCTIVELLSTVHAVLDSRRNIFDVALISLL